MQLGWTYVETSTLAVDTANVDVILRAAVLIARQNADVCAKGGHLSGLGLQVVWATNFAIGTPYPAAANHPNALLDIQAKPLP